MIYFYINVDNETSFVEYMKSKNIVYLKLGHRHGSIMLQGIYSYYRVDILQYELHVLKLRYDIRMTLHT